MLRAESTPPIAPDSYKQLKFRYLGPVGNRVIAIAGVPGNPNVYYAGAASGGVFKTTDNGAAGRSENLDSILRKMDFCPHRASTPPHPHASRGGP